MGQFRKGELIFYRKGDENRLALVCKEIDGTYIVCTELITGELDHDIITEESIFGSIRFSDKLAGLGRYIMPKRGGPEIGGQVEKVL